MAWTRPTIREICIGMEINGYLPAETLTPAPLRHPEERQAADRFGARFGGRRGFPAMELRLPALPFGSGR